MRSRSAGGIGVEQIAGRNEHDFAQIERHFQIVIGKREVLFGVERFQSAMEGSPR